jgi:DNA mismatch repair protein MutL
MSTVIKLLPDSIANQIAAGEVVQRPASVVKELLENALDAGATEISLIFKQAGVSSIQVMDNGRGMNELDARMCWERHATSKITKADDLYSLTTFGFRGEALASIAAVAQVELKTKQKESPLGTYVRIEGSEVKEQEATSMKEGTTITVKNLFFNVPARRNFLKSQSVETKHIMEEFVRVALANPEVGMNLYNDKSEVYKLPSGKLDQRLIDIFGKRYKDKLIFVEEETEIVNIRGYIGVPELAKRTRGEQYFFANNRFIREPYFYHALMGGFEGLLEKDMYPFFVLFLEVDPSKIDVNVHPTKTEVKFEDGKSIYAILRSVVQRSLGSHMLTPNLEGQHFDGGLSNITPNSFKPQGPVKSPFSRPKELSQNPFSEPVKSKELPHWEKLYEAPEGEPVTIKSDVKPQTKMHWPEEHTIESAFQIQNKFIGAKVNGILTVFHQYRAHQRILYEQFLRDMNTGSGTSQQLLFPRTVDFAPHEMAIIQDLLPILNKAGYDIHEFGKNSIIINGTPPIQQKGNEEQHLKAILAEYVKSEQLEMFGNAEKLAYSLALNGAVRSGTPLDTPQVKNLITGLLTCEKPGYSPTGKPIMLQLSSEKLQELLGS